MHFKPNKYRTHTTAMLGENILGEKILAAGWVENIRDHGGIKFVDLRDHYGIVQITFQQNAELLTGIHRESCVSVGGEAVKRSEDTINTKITTGTIEIMAERLEILGNISENLPFEITSSKETNEELRLRYRFLDLRNPAVHDAVIYRSQVISYMRQSMNEMGFLEMNTPILSASSPEGARDFLVPSRRHHGKFYALPQAPQIFKQLYMISGFDRYFQIAPCFRDEDARADRTAGEFYQLDIEMAFAEQEDVFTAGEAVLSSVLRKFGINAAPAPYQRLTYAETMLKYGTDKPDLRNPLFITELSDLFEGSGFKPFADKTVRGIRVPGMAAKSKSFFKSMEEFALSIGMGGLGYVEVQEDMSFKGPIDKFISEETRTELKTRAGLEAGDVLYFIADIGKTAEIYAGQIRAELGNRLELIDKDRLEICWIYDFPMYEEDETGKPAFSHNPFSMPKGGLDALNGDPFDVIAYQYDFVINGVELASGAVRNHSNEIMVKAFEIAGYSESDLKQRFGALYGAFKFGAPPHAGMAFGVDRLLMLMLKEDSVREVIAFPLNGNAQDLLLGAPSEVTEQQLREVHIKVREKH
ncbi:MAG: aspartate--tRNA ligase [Oscillospiraceae bacterium]|jgi:aspartyl-tRNA synthetase|nr:aspartate--tRNA ligase [Oscillospiraceae bacterium]